MAQSVEQINAAIIGKLRESTDAGLPVDQLTKSIKSTTKKEIQTRLYDLQNKGEVERLPGNKWRVAPQTAAPAAVQAPLATNGAAAAAAPVNTHPLIKIPGMNGWASYKNSLQEYCQKMKYDVPKYTSEKESGGFASTVCFGSNTMVKGTQGRASAKESDQQAAFEALIALEYLPRESTFQEAAKPPIGVKRKEPPTDMMDIQPPQKQVNVDEPHMFKSRLNELAQKNRLPAPSWDTVSTAGGFFSTVTFNGRQFKSSQCVPKKKDSQQNASHMALYLLQQVVQPPQGYNDKMAAEAPGCGAIESMIAEARAITTSNKSKLHEHAQKMKFSELQLPRYETTMAEDKSCISTLTVNGANFQSDISKSKKGAEQSAAFKALVALNVAEC